MRTAIYRGPERDAAMAKVNDIIRTRAAEEGTDEFWVSRRFVEYVADLLGGMRSMFCYYGSYPEGNTGEWIGGTGREVRWTLKIVRSGSARVTIEVRETDEEYRARIAKIHAEMGPMF